MKANSKSLALVNARKRAQRAESPIVISARRILRRKPDGKKETWADSVMHSLIKIGTKEKKSIIALQAIRMILQQSGSPAPANAAAAIDDADDNIHMEVMNEEEIDARIAELMKTLGSVPQNHLR
jgi:hypothetical protein